MADDSKFVRDMDRILLRVPDGIRERLAFRAKNNERSMNAEAVDILERALDASPEAMARRLFNQYRNTVRRIKSLEEQAERLRAARDEMRGTISKLIEDPKLAAAMIADAEREDDTTR